MIKEQPVKAKRNGGKRPNEEREARRYMSQRTIWFIYKKHIKEAKMRRRNGGMVYSEEIKVVLLKNKLQRKPSRKHFVTLDLPLSAVEFLVFKTFVQ